MRVFNCFRTCFISISEALKPESFRSCCTGVYVQANEISIVRGNETIVSCMFQELVLSISSPRLKLLPVLARPNPRPNTCKPYCSTDTRFDFDDHSLVLLRRLVCEAAENHGNVTAAGAAEPALINLDETWPCFKFACFVEHSFWKSLPSDKIKWLQDYSSMAASLCELGTFVFAKLAPFSHLPNAQRTPATVREWTTDLPDRLGRWLQDRDLLDRFESCLVSPCKTHLKGLFSQGLESLGQTVQQCVNGKMGSGLSQEMLQQLLQQIPAEHPLRPLGSAFLQARQVS